MSMIKEDFTALNIKHQDFNDRLGQLALLQRRGRLNRFYLV